MDRACGHNPGQEERNGLCPQARTTVDTIRFWLSPTA